MHILTQRLAGGVGMHRLSQSIQYAGQSRVACLEAIEVFKRFGAIEALRNVSFAVKPREIHALCGENGAGKSTLVKILTPRCWPTIRQA